MFDHEKIFLQHPRHVQPVAVDRDIAPLIQTLWRLGINTDDSCQSMGPGHVWIQFSSAHDAEKFLSMVAGIRDCEGPEAADGLYFRMLSTEGGWEYEVAPWDTNLLLDPDEKGGEFAGPPEMVLPVGVKFPMTDYFRVLHLLRTTHGF